MHADDCDACSYELVPHNDNHPTLEAVREQFPLPVPTVHREFAGSEAPVSVPRLDMVVIESKQWKNDSGFHAKGAGSTDTAKPVVVVHRGTTTSNNANKRLMQPKETFLSIFNAQVGVRRYVFFFLSQFLFF